MSIKQTDLDSIVAAKAKLAEQIKALEQEEAELRRQQINQAFDKVLALLNGFASQFSSKQKADIATFFGDEAVAKKQASKRKSSRQEVQPKYWLPHSGDTWSGRGRMPKAFAAWHGSASYKEWKAKHPDEKFPKYPGD